MGPHGPARRLRIRATGIALGALVALLVAPSSAQAEPTFSVKMDFGAATTTPVTGNVLDYGQAFGARTGAGQGTGLEYGWVGMTGTTPLSLVGNGRDRGTAETDRLRATLMHMQLPASSTGVKTPGRWEIAVPNGTYRVSVTTGDATSVDSTHALQIENQNAVDTFVPTTSTRYRTATVSANVADGRLTVSPATGTNTKITHLTVDPVADASQHPEVRAMTPANTATDVSPTGSIVADLRLIGSGVDAASLASSTVTLKESVSGAAVATRVITSGGGDVINVSPTAGLKANTRYVVEVTSGAKDLTGRTFTPWRSVFTTGAAGGGGDIAFAKVASGASGRSFTSVVKGPDGKLYASTLDGYIVRWTIAADGTLTGAQTISTVRTDATARALPGAPNRTIIGLAFDPASTAAAPILWVSSNTMYAGGTPSEPDFSSSVAKLTGPALGTYTEVVSKLPRSVKDHETNSLAFGPDGALYISQGANNAMGAPDGAWGNRPERLLSAAVLRLDPAKLPQTLPLNVQTEGGGTYDPFTATAPLTLYATGVRNAYDLVWHSNGHLYTPTNGSAAGGNAPASPVSLPAACNRRIDSATSGPYTGPAVPALTNNPNAETDYIFDVKKNRYYGHPNPSRCEWVLAAGNPTSGSDPFQAAAYPVGTQPDRNLDLAGIYDAGLHASANGVVEYRSGAFGGALRGKLLVVRYSSGQDIAVFGVDAQGRPAPPLTGTAGMTGFQQPLDVTEDTATGNLYVTELGANRITLLRPAS
ncbi:Ig-like domain-containing protein [Streptomyces mesophilus]|uniref:Ig-like domain-containing protein n=1 Tax=Streptomyces mesophilus TaxID=1775132 RepID=UPI0019D20D46|nr:Ig-like domain-containing protein [Streptomyces mesophilus]